jgi:integrase
MKEKQWKKQWKNVVRRTKLPGVWERKEGGYLVRARALDPTTGKMVEVKKVLPGATEASAYQWLQQELDQVRSGSPTASPEQKPRFADYAVSLLERKIAKGKISSAMGREKWRYTLEHLIKGTKGVAWFGEMFMEQIRSEHIEQWQMGISKLIADGTYAPTTANSWLNVLKVVFKTAKRERIIAVNPIEGIDSFDTSEHATYTEEEPNALDAEEAQRFLNCMRGDFPQHYAMTYLGFATGLRPSSLRPLRRKGATPDVLWDETAILVRRSHTLGEEVMQKTKTGLRQRINLPAQVMEVLRWHVETMLVTPEQQASDLLFPRDDGLFRSESALKKSFAEVRRLIGLKKKFSPRGMRRTFNDLARAAKVESLVTKSISGHLTDRMKDHYSTVSPTEQRQSIDRLLTLVHGKVTTSGVPSSGAPGGAPTSASGAPDGTEDQ